MPFLDDDTAAAAWASFLIYVRQPNFYATFIMPLVLLVIFVVLRNGAGYSAEDAQFLKSLAPSFAIVLPFIVAGLFLFNVFGVDRDGFRMLVLLPTERRKYFLARNLAMLPFVVGLGLVCVAVAAVVVRPGVRVLAISVMQVGQLYLLFCTVGNFVSILLPAQWAGPGMRARNKSAQFLTVLASFSTLWLLLIPTAVCLFVDASFNYSVGYQGVPPGPIISAAFLIGAFLIYRWSLPAAGRLLLHREQYVLDKLTRDRE